MGIKWEAEQISSVNAILILAFIPLFSFGVYPGLRKLGIKVTPLRKREHRAILDAVAAGDEKAARRAATQHHLNGEKRLVMSGVIKPPKTVRTRK